ncbi:MAG TPA: GGDEF domain-containing protein [Candidatus Dormibacteraeota bacterium]
MPVSAVVVLIATLVLGVELGLGAYFFVRMRATFRRLREEGGYDFLTAVHTRREGLRLGADLVLQCYRHGFQVAAVVLDIDHFKQINDTHGHRTGDLVLAEFAARLRGSLRAGDFAIRLGGEEFCVFLSHAAEEQALEAAWRLLRAIRLRPVRTAEGTLMITASAGVAGWRRRESVDSLIDRADQALYEAKRSGRDRARAFGRLAGAPLTLNA